MRSKSQSEGSLKEFVLSGRLPLKALVILVMGLLLIVIGGLNFESNESTARSDEEKIAELCSLSEGVGECRVMVTYTPDGNSVYAVTVLCDGANSTEVRGRVTEMICSLYGIGAHRVTVMKLAE